MSDITKARYFFQTKGSKLKDLQSFGLMLATATSKYRDVRRTISSGMAGDREIMDPVEINALIDYALLMYLKNNNRLPSDAPKVLHAGTSLEDKKLIALTCLRR